MSSWQLHDAKARFSEFLDATLKNGPQVVTRRGVAAAVMIPMAEWRRLQDSARPNLKSLLLEREPRWDGLMPRRRTFRRRPPLDLK
jgi:antitoxin Phd